MLLSEIFYYKRKEYIMKKLAISIALGFLIAVSLVCTVNKTEYALSNGVIRLHVKANSNSDEDQVLKLKVRDRILKEMEELSQSGASIEDIRRKTAESLKNIENIAIEEIKKQGYNYDVTAKLGKSEFPTKTYGDMTLPAGTYEALVVEIGSGDGENWWCVMFPPLCFADEAYAGTSPASEEILISNLGKDTYSMVKSDKIQIKFKVYELIQNIW